ncbi:large conductance mechanosensitive channel [Carnobacterium iners]|uniref:Large-conductance mechanosensitive channel n=1 Tax=Carnobacterium iners TaxID=1073423 RepID=A0A1X7MS66_9LACT|nr:large conductance mechanosensitive channel protein MscL [Carnobacterium iners]SEL00576.1 large conductance mechanosensitive channel [Carnobacterium iners]SMH27171.1 large conductance mechanosensitive channel [Carnobacterium iners]
MRNFINEFKKFAFRGNVLDLAVGIVIGAAFTTIVSSLVEDIIMPFVGMLTGGHDISALSINIGTAKLAYGSFLQAILNFLIIALAIFIFIKIISNAAAKFRQEEEIEKLEIEIPAAEKYLKDIRDLLAKETSPIDLS